MFSEFIQSVSHIRHASTRFPTITRHRSRLEFVPVYSHFRFNLNIEPHIILRLLTDWPTGGRDEEEVQTQRKFAFWEISVVNDTSMEIIIFINNSEEKVIRSFVRWLNKYEIRIVYCPTQRTMSTFSRFSVFSYKIFFMKRERIKYTFFHFEYLIMGAKFEKEFDYTKWKYF